MTKSSDSRLSAPRATFESRETALRARVAEAAQTLIDRGIQPTVTRIRAALGGGSPNDLGPALKAWRDARSPLGGVSANTTAGAGRVPPPVADLAKELWQRARAAAVLEVRHGPTAQALNAGKGEIEGLRTQLNGARAQLEREARAYGELRAQAARHEVIAKQALTRADQAERRVRELLRELGEARQEVAQLTATLKQRQRRLSKETDATRQNGRLASRPKRASRARATLSITRRRTGKKRSSKPLENTSKKVGPRRRKEGRDKRSTRSRPAVRARARAAVKS